MFLKDEREISLVTILKETAPQTVFESGRL